MRNKIVYKFIGKVLIAFSLLFIFPCLVGIIYRENIIHFIIPQVLSLIIGLLLNNIKTGDYNYFAKDGFYIVSLSWIVISLIGSLPFYIHGDASFINSLFETISGFTTTGATIFQNVEVLDKSILFWRSFTHFIGGMGVLAFVMTIVPLASADKSMHLLKAEMPGPSVGKLVPSIKKTLVYLYGIYLFLTISEILLLVISGLSLFDSTLLSFGTAGTGGFALLNTSLSTYPVISKIIVGIFMFLFGVNFNIYFLIIMKDIKSIFKSEELKVYLLLFIFTIIFVFINTYQYFSNSLTALLEAFFHSSSLITSTGYSIGNINIYPTNCRVVILFIMLVSACAGSTCGGFKISRLIICLKSIRRDFLKIINPNRVENIMFEGKKVPDSVVKSTNTFLFMYFVLILIILFIVSFDGYSLETTINSVVGTFANVGLCFSIDNFYHFSSISKIALSIGMLLGRLEIFPIVSLFVDLRRK